ncbi:DUF6635 family protein [Pseudooceanicola sp. C21-150M6]|uniref:DUF6635 family protein n=1 Tax=Pseudooceanicola sp. C21-150M6 TaxID=3434355 RepID=UPI003D7FA4D0
MTPDPDTSKARRARLRGFCRATFGLRGTLQLHRAALGWDLLKAPLNVVLAPVFLLTRLLALLARALRLRRLSDWLASRRILLPTAVAQEVGRRLDVLLQEMAEQGLIVPSPEPLRRAVIADYVGTRSAVAEIATTLLVIASGLFIFHTPTFGVMTLAGPVAELRAQSTAIADFPLGSGLGRLYYGVFPSHIGPSQLLITGLVLSVCASLFTTFAGIVADPVQLATGTHRRRLDRMLRRLDAARHGGLEREHLLARAGDLSDIALSLWRMLRG